MIHAMIDIETLDTKNSAVVVSIGAVKFRQQDGVVHTYDSFYKVLNRQTQIDVGRTVSQGTLDWWMKQSDKARAVFNEPVSDVAMALLSLGDFMRDVVGGVWGNGAMFDNAIIYSLADTFKTVRPWSYKLDRCYRTLKNMCPMAPMVIVDMVAHNALDDAKYQAAHLLSIASEMGLTL